MRATVLEVLGHQFMGAHRDRREVRHLVWRVAGLARRHEQCDIVAPRHKRLVEEAQRLMSTPPNSQAEFLFMQWGMSESSMSESSMSESSAAPGRTNSFFAAGCVDDRVRKDRATALFTCEHGAEHRAVLDDLRRRRRTRRNDHRSGFRARRPFSFRDCAARGAAHRWRDGSGGARISNPASRLAFREAGAEWQIHLLSVKFGCEWLRAQRSRRGQHVRDRLQG